MHTGLVFATILIAGATHAPQLGRRVEARPKRVAGSQKGSPPQPLQIGGAKAPKDSVSVVGNFAGEFTTTGFGLATSTSQTVYIDVDVKKAGIAFAATGFGPITYPGLGTVGTVTYEMALMTGTPTSPGVVVSGPVSGTDAGFNGKQVLTNDPPSNGRMVLRLTRTVTLSAKAPGNQTLSASGQIVLTIL